MSNFLPFHSFFDEYSAAETARILQANDIPIKILRKGKQFDSILVGESMSQDFELQIAGEDFERANKLLQDVMQKDVDIDIFGEDYYLFSFSEDELVDIVKKPDEWGNQDIVVAKQLLRKKGIEFSEQELQQIKQDRLLELSKPEKFGGYRIPAGYIGALLFGFAGILIGYSLWKSKKILPNGKKVHTYTESTRSHGEFIFYLSTALFIYTILHKLLTQQRMLDFWVW